MNKFGDGLVTLLMFALGLGCLNVALQGLIDGSLSGSRGASFAFASKPIKFVLIELFWVGFGLILLLGAWRGVSRQDTDVDDKQDDDDEGTRPMRAPAKPLSEVTGISKAPVLATSTTNSGSFGTDPASAPAKAVAPMPLELYPSRFYAVLVIVLSTFFAISSAFTAVALTSMFDQVFVVVMFTPIGLVYVAMIAQCVRNFFWDGPVLLLDKFGITNYRKGGHLIPWTELDAVRIDAEKSATYLILRFRHAGDVHRHFGKARWLQSIIGHLFYKGFEGRVKLTTLVFKKPTVLQTAQAFIRYSRR